jgi:glucose/arabinose dehydrogenase
MGFDSKGNLFLSTGDNTDPCCEGYAPIDERPGREHQDAQGTSANTNDLRGKILRIHARRTTAPTRSRPATCSRRAPRGPVRRSG